MKLPQTCWNFTELVNLGPSATELFAYSNTSQGKQNLKLQFYWTMDNTSLIVGQKQVHREPKKE
jgi:hypothetical protein